MDATKELTIGDMAPGIQGLRFLKGDRITALNLGTVYVVEFWATWCGPCITNMAHLTALQSRHPSIPIIGIAAHDKNIEAVAALVGAKADQIGYRIAFDDPATKWMLRNWFEPSYEDGIPVAFVIDREGRVAWIGYPSELDAPLQSIFDGTWDLQEAFDTRQQSLAASFVREKAAVNREVARYTETDDVSGILRTYDEAFVRTPTLEADYGMMKLQLLLEHDPKTAVAYAKTLTELFAKEGAYSSSAHLLLYQLGNTLWECTPKSADPDLIKELAGASLASLALAERSLAKKPSIGLSMYVNEAFAHALIMDGQPNDAMVRARKAYALAQEGNFTFKFAAIEAIIERLTPKGAMDTVSNVHGTAVVREGDTCRIVST